MTPSDEAMSRYVPVLSLCANCGGLMRPITSRRTVSLQCPACRLIVVLPDQARLEQVTIRVEPMRSMRRVK